MSPPKYLWWKFEPLDSMGDVIFQNDIINYELYFRWRNSLWECKNPIRHPNKINRRKNTQFALCIDKEENEHRLDYITTRKQIYVKEYIRLIKELPEYKKLLDKLKNSENIMICEMDVPANNKRGEYGKNCDENNICHMSIEKIRIIIK